MKNDSDSMKKYQENAESWASYSRMRARRLRPDAELTEGATNGCEDKKEFSDEIPSSIRSANVGHLPNYYSRRLDGISSYHILSTNHLTSIKGWGVEFFCHGFLSNRPPSNYSMGRLVSSYPVFTKKPASTSQTRGSGNFLLLIPTWPSLILLNQGLAILPRGEILYNTDRIDPVAQADGPGNEINEEPKGTKEGRKRDEIEIRGCDFFLSLTKSVFTTGAGKTAFDYSFNYNNR